MFGCLAVILPLCNPILNTDSADFKQTHHILMLLQVDVILNAKALVNGNSQFRVVQPNVELHHQGITNYQSHSLKKVWAASNQPTKKP